MSSSTTAADGNLEELSFIDDGLWGFEVTDAGGYVVAFFRLRRWGVMRKHEPGGPHPEDHDVLVPTLRGKHTLRPSAA